MLTDVSEDLRDREEFSLHQLMAGSRLVVSAVSHEIRNLCSAISVVHANLARDAALGQKEDFQALSGLVEGLEKIATLELRQGSGSQQISSVDLYSVLDELRIVTEAPLRESDIRIRWDLPGDLPRIWADRHNLLQILLNLVKNSQRAVEDEARKEIFISAAHEGTRVVLRVRDTGPGVASPERLFQPFQPGAESSGLGLYISRAFARSFEGDLRYESNPGGSWCFALCLTAFAYPEDDKEPTSNGQDQNSARRRSHAVPGSAEPLARE
jgi:C4-dicarboxylate-specific signal transduction histidine kinase